MATIPGAVGAWRGGLAGLSAAIAQRGIGSMWDDVIAGLALSSQAPSWQLAALTKAVIARESEWNPNARNPQDPSYGLMQVMVPTARFFFPGITAEELMDPPTNITAGMSYLRDQVRGVSTLDDAVRGYTCGRERAGDLGCKPGYVADVLAYYDWYVAHDPLIAYLAGTGASDGTPTLELELELAQPAPGGDQGPTASMLASPWVIVALAIAAGLVLSD